MMQLIHLGFKLVFHILGVKSRHWESSSKHIHTLPQGSNIGITLQALDKVNKLGSTLLLDLQCNLKSLMEELAYLFKVLLDHLTSSHGTCTNTNTSGCHSRSISRNTVLIQSDGHGITHLLELTSSNFLRFQVPKNQVILRSTGCKTVSQTNKLGSKSCSVLLYLLGVNVELGCHDLQQLSGYSSNLMLMWSTLKSGEDSLVNLVFKSTLILTEEDHTGTRSTKGLVSSGSNNITIFKWRLLLLGGNQSRNMCHVHEEEGTVGIGNFAEAFVVPVTGVGGSTADDHGWFEKTGITFKLIVVNVSGNLVHLVGE
mmetsp:Transcript_14876/g.22899  ORF Transcript_14876/g.22899 Transcript_14876/m.22899 type:complete len:313 (+) Transcript_14876:83-1021(+)